MSKKKKKLKTLVKAGQIYRVPRLGKPAHHVRVVRVVRINSDQPKVHYRPVTKSGKKKPIAYGLTHLTSWLHWDGSMWVPPSVWQLMD